LKRLLAVVLKAEVGNQVLTHDVPKSVLQLHGLDKEIVLGVNLRRVVRVLEVEAEPFLNTETLQAAGAGGEVHEKNQVERKRRSKDRIATEEVNLELHGISQPAEDVDIVPTLFVITTRRVIVVPKFVLEVLV
jgi:hypothetical protein